MTSVLCKLLLKLSRISLVLLWKSVPRYFWACYTNPFQTHRSLILTNLLSHLNTNGNTSIQAAMLQGSCGMISAFGDSDPSSRLFRFGQTTDLYRVDMVIQVGGSEESQLFGLKI